MRKAMVSAAGSVAAFIVCLPLIPLTGGVSHGQVNAPKDFPPPGVLPPKPPPKRDKPSAPSLDEMIATAMKANPDLRVAQAKVAEAEAELYRTRLMVTQKVTTLHRAIAAQRDSVQAAEKNFQQFEKMYLEGTSSESNLAERKATLAQAKSKLAEMEAELPYLLGQSTVSLRLAPNIVEFHWNSLSEQQFSTNDDAVDKLRNRAFRGLNPTATEAEATKQAVSALQEYYKRLEIEQLINQKAKQPAEANPIRQALDTKITVDYKDIPFTEALQDLSKKVNGAVNFQTTALDQSKLPQIKVSMYLANIPLGAVLQATEDKFPPHTGLVGPGVEDPDFRFGLRFLVRDYGILATWLEPPAGAVRVHDFWKSRPIQPPKADARTTPTKPVPPPEKKPEKP